MSLFAAALVAPGQASAKPTSDEAAVRDVPCFSLTCPRPLVTVNGSMRVKTDDDLGALGLGGIPFRVLHDVYGGAAGVPVTDGSGEPVVGSVNEDGTFAATFEYPWLFVDETGWHPGCQDFQGLPSFPGVERNACTHDSVYLLFDLVSADGSVRVVDTQNKIRSVRMNVGRWFQYPDELNAVTDFAAARAYRAALDVKEVMPGDEEPVTLRMNGANTYFDPGTGLVHLHQERNSVRSAITESAIAQAFLSHAYPDGSYPGQGCPQGAWLSFPSMDMSDACSFVYGTAAFIGVQADLRNRGADQSPTFQRGPSYGYSVETCLTQNDPRFGCAEGPGEPLRITAVLWDLADSANETADSEGAGQSFADFTDYSFGAVNAHLLADVPVDVNELWDGWKANHAAQDRLIFFMNTLEYTDLQDEELATNVAGTWEDTECNTCRDLSGSLGGSAPSYRENRPGDYRFTDPAGGSAEISWDLGRHMTEAGDYDVWVRLPAGQAGDETNAIYTVDIVGGAQQVALNQATTTDNWVRLPDVFDMDPAGDNLVRLRNTTGSTDILKADAVILAPHDGATAPPAPPRVRITGKVETPRRHELNVEDPMRPISDAWWRLQYRGKGGNQSDPVEWRPVRTGYGPNDPEVNGYLSRGGEFDIEITYPQNHVRPSGETWFGCEPTDVAYLSSTACAHEDLVLEVFAINADRSVKVKAPGHEDMPDDAEPMLTIDLGLFFRRPRLIETAHSFAAAAYGAAYNVREFVGSGIGNVHIQLHEGMGPDTYDPDTREIHLGTVGAKSGTPEHEVAHSAMHHWYGNDYEQWERGCGTEHYFTTVSTEDCAWHEGFAHWLAVASENDPGFTTWTKMAYDSGGDADLERCVIEPDIECRSGPAVEGNIASALFDLFDNNPPSDPNAGSAEAKNSFVDVSNHPALQILEVVRNDKPHTVAEFLAAWVDFLSGEQRDFQTFWLNTLHFEGVFDARQENATGEWKVLTCTPGACLADSAMSTNGEQVAVTWDVSPAVTDINHRSETWDIWVNIVGGEALDANARYAVRTKNGIHTVVVDQQANQGEWVQLNPAAGFQLNPDDIITVTLSRSDGLAPGLGSALVADGLVIARRLPW
ncbi:hypothetical protein [Catellatospora sp. NPDC049609]|uniref:golvesin C-terminal-like domain-containing protein n=1 Tax=Catellatospora sp. NPDC049609 TaxID=3155505 RepID=UPI00343F187B